MFPYVMQDAINQYLEVRNKLLDTREELLEKLREIDRLLGSSGDIEAVQAVSSKKSAKKPGRKPGRKASTKTGRKTSSKSFKKSFKLCRQGARKQNAMSLKEVISKALTVGALDRKAILEAVKNLGYKFSTNNPLNSLTVSLYTHKGIHKNGKLYSLKSGLTKQRLRKQRPRKQRPRKQRLRKQRLRKQRLRKQCQRKRRPRKLHLKRYLSSIGSDGFSRHFQDANHSCKARFQGISLFSRDCRVDYAPIRCVLWFVKVGVPGLVFAG